MSEEALKFIEQKLENGIATILLNRPDKLNIFNSDALEELKRTLEDLGNNPKVKVVILASNSDKIFTGGADIKEMHDKDSEEARFFSIHGHQVANKLESLPVPVIAAINGHSMGGGVEFICACDIRIGTENAVFAQPEIDIGIIPGWGGTQRLARIIGIGRAKELIYTGRRINAYEALELGLLNQVVSNGELMDAANAVAKTIASKSRVAIISAKQAMNLVFENALKDGLQQEIEAWAKLFDTYDQKEGMRAFLERRKPEFKDK